MPPPKTSGGRLSVSKAANASKSSISTLFPFPRGSSARARTSVTSSLSTPPSRRLKSSNVVSTDVSAYSRTDPMGAFNTLLRLFTSLSTRAGACQYKLSSGEHALSLHLMSIMEPYVFQGARAFSMLTGSASSSPSKASPTTSLHQTTMSATELVSNQFQFQPTEILDDIISFIPSKKDLLSLGLTCKRLHSVVIPRHFDYRVVKCKASSTKVWKHLAAQRGLARNVRRVEVVDERAKVVVPRGGTSATSSAASTQLVIPRTIPFDDTDLDASSSSSSSTISGLSLHAKHEKHLIGALNKMTGLTEFKWSTTHSLIKFTDKVWPALANNAGASLERLDVLGHEVFVAFRENEPSDESGCDEASDGEGQHDASGKLVRSRHMLPNLRSISFVATRHANLGPNSQPSLSRVARVLEKCPNVESITIDFTRPVGTIASMPASHPAMDPLLGLSSSGTFSQTSFFKNLRVLRLHSLWTLSLSSFAHFLEAHPTIEGLNVVDSRIGGGPGGQRLELRPGTLPRLTQLEAGRDIVNAILSDESKTCLRPLEVVKGFDLSGSPNNHLNRMATLDPTDQTSIILSNLKRHAATIKHVELGSWYDMDDVRRLAKSLPNLTYLDLGKRTGGINLTVRCASGRGGSGGPTSQPPVTNLDEWLEVLVDLPELRALHGVKFFYEVDESLISNQHVNVSLERMSVMDRSRMKKNDQTASKLVWRCPKLRRVDHWEDLGAYNRSGSASATKIIVLTRSGGGGSGGSGDQVPETSGATVKWEVKRVKA